jgi:putative phage-type endonuclease
MPELIPAEPGTAEWHAARRLGVTATDIVTILGLSHWDSPYSLFWRKLGQVPDVEDNARFRLGRYLEQYAADRWDDENPSDMLKAGGLYRNTGWAWQMATTDRLVHKLAHHDGKVNGTYVDPHAVWEGKSWADADRRSWDDGPPPTVRAQVLWQMDVMDAAAGHVGVLFLPSGEFRSYTIEHDAGCTYPDYPDDGGWLDCDVCKDVVFMRAAGFEFMRRLRLELPPPDPDSSAATLAAVRARFAKAPGKEAEINSDLFMKWDLARKQMEDWTDSARALEIRIREQAGEASILTVGGVKVATRVVSDAQVKAHTRHVDYYRRVTVKESDGEA